MTLSDVVIIVLMVFISHEHLLFGLATYSKSFFFLPNILLVFSIALIFIASDTLFFNTSSLSYSSLLNVSISCCVGLDLIVLVGDMPSSLSESESSCLCSSDGISSSPSESESSTPGSSGGIYSSIVVKDSLVFFFGLWYGSQRWSW